MSDAADTKRTPHTFFVSDGIGGVSFRSVGASDLQSSQTATSQTFRFTPATAMEAGQTVTVDLDSAQGITTGSGSGQPSPVDYRSASVNTGGSTLRGGNAAFSFGNNGQSGQLTYTVGSGGLASDEEVSIQVQDVRTQTQPTTVSGVTFTWSGGGSQTTGFQVG